MESRAFELEIGPGKPFQRLTYGIPIQLIVAISAAFSVYVVFWPDVIQVLLGWTAIALMAMIWRRVPFTFFLTLGVAAGFLYYGATVILSLFTWSGGEGHTTGAIIVGATVALAPMLKYGFNRLTR